VPKRLLDPHAIHEWTDGDYLVTTDRARVDLDTTHRFIAEGSYWDPGRTRAISDHLVANSRCYSLLHTPSDEQVGFARVVTDGQWFAWIGDVFVLAEHRGGRGKFLMRCLMEDLAPVWRVALDTRDAHGLYAQFGFATPTHVDRMMERRNVDR
jgi:GNAT acetyltransferase-like protein